MLYRGGCCGGLDGLVVVDGVVVVKVNVVVDVVAAVEKLCVSRRLGEL